MPFDEFNQALKKATSNKDMHTLFEQLENRVKAREAEHSPVQIPHSPRQDSQSTEIKKDSVKALPRPISSAPVPIQLSKGTGKLGLVSHLLTRN